MSPDPDEQFTFHYEILHGFRASSSTLSGALWMRGGSFSLGDAKVVVLERPIER